MKKRLKAQHQHARPGTLAHKLLPFSYAAISAIIGTQSVLLAKSSSELVRTTLGGNNQFDSPFTYFILTAWITSMVFWLYRMNAALRKFDGVFIIPVLQVVWTLFSIVGGGVYFREFSKFDTKDTALFTLGVCVVIFGVYLLAPQTVRPQDDAGAEEEPGMEERVLTIANHGGHDTEMTSVHNAYPAAGLQPAQIRQILAQSAGHQWTTSPPHKYTVVPTHSSRPSSDASPASKSRSFSFSSSHSSPSSDSQTDPDSPSSASDTSPERQSLSPSSQSSRSPQQSLQIVLDPPHHPSRIHLLPQDEEGKLVHGDAAHGGDAVGGYGGLEVDSGGGSVTPKRGRTRGMSLGFSIPLIEMDDQM